MSKNDPSSRRSPATTPPAPSIPAPSTARTLDGYQYEATPTGYTVWLNGVVVHHVGDGGVIGLAATNEQRAETWIRLQG